MQKQTCILQTKTVAIWLRRSRSARVRTLRYATSKPAPGMQSRSAPARPSNLPPGWRATWCTDWRQYYYWRVRDRYATWTPPPACILEAAWAYEASRRKDADAEAKRLPTSSGLRGRRLKQLAKSTSDAYFVGQRCIDNDVKETWGTLSGKNAPYLCKTLTSEEAGTIFVHDCELCAKDRRELLEKAARSIPDTRTHKTLPMAHTNTSPTCGQRNETTGTLGTGESDNTNDVWCNWRRMHTYACPLPDPRTVERETARERERVSRELARELREKGSPWAPPP